MKLFVLVSFLLSNVISVAQQAGTSGLLKKAGGVLNKVKSGQSTLSNEEIIAGLKEALSVGANNSSSKLSAEDGFFGNQIIKVLLPQEVSKVEKTLKSIGMSHLVDNAILSMNRAAEEASKSAAPIFINAIRQMNFQDALGILKGNDSAATVYLRNKTFQELAATFRPVIEKALEQTGATKHWKNVFDKYNSLPTTFRKVNSDLAGHVTEKALAGLFYQVALEEQKIRKDPAARVNDILKKVFTN